MRYLFFGLVFLVWSAYCTLRYTCHIKQTCCKTESSEVVAPNISGSKAMTENASIQPMLFKWSDEKVITNESQTAFVDSIMGLIKNQDQLEITGEYFKDEINNTEYSNLGLARAAAARDLFKTKLDSNRILTKSKIASLTGDVRNSEFEAIRFLVKMNNDFIKEVGDGTLIYFPPNSTKKLENPTIDAYLASIANQLKQNNKTIILTGHTDAIGPAKSNYELAYFRAGAIKDVLLEKGLADDRIIVRSEGELKPIGSNKTNEGRKMNRRVELTIQ